jgi:hypothetical protein
MEKDVYTLTYPATEHNQRYRWLLQQAKITQQDSFEYNDENITIKVQIDEVTYQRYLKHFEKDKFQSQESKQGWKKPSKSR